MGETGESFNPDQASNPTNLPVDARPHIPSPITAAEFTEKTTIEPGLVVEGIGDLKELDDVMHTVGLHTLSARQKTFGNVRLVDSWGKDGTQEYKIGDIIIQFQFFIRRRIDTIVLGSCGNNDC